MDSDFENLEDLSIDQIESILQFYAEHGVDETIGEDIADFTHWGASFISKNAQAQINPPQAQATQPERKPFQPKPTEQRPVAQQAPMTALPSEALAEAKELAAKAADIESLREAILNFNGCSLKRTARNTVIDDGIFGAELMILGEAPGKQEDQQGKPFVGQAGQLLDKMLAAIGYSRHDENKAQGSVRDMFKPAYITNSLYWRPPGNRNPTQEELLICKPFVERIITLSKPKIIMTLGNVPTQNLIQGAVGITKMRGNLQKVKIGENTYQVLPSFHPAFLLRQPTQKASSWLDLLAAKKILLA